MPGLAEKPSHCEFRMRPYDQVQQNACWIQRATVRLTNLSIGQNLPQIDTDEALVADTLEDKAAASNGVDTDTSGESGGEPDGPGGRVDVEALQSRCNELEARVAQLNIELENAKKFYGSGSESIPRSDTSKASGRADDNSFEIPLGLVLAATAGAMKSPNEADRTHLLEQELRGVNSPNGTTDQGCVAF